MYTLYHIHKPQKSNTGVNGTQLVDQKLNLGEFSTWRDCSKFFFFKLVVRPSKKSPELHLQPQAKYSTFHPKPKIWLIMTKHPMTSDNSAELVKMLLCQYIS